MWPRGVDGFPVHFSKRGIVGKPLHKIRICDVWTTKRYQICQPLRDKAIATITVHLYVCHQSAFIERAEMPEHAIVDQFLKWSARKVSCIPHEQQVREIVGIELPNCIFGNRQSFGVGLKCTAFVHRADLDSNPPCVDLPQDRLDYLEKKARAIFQASAVLVFAQVGGGIDKL